MTGLLNDPDPHYNKDHTPKTLFWHPHYDNGLCSVGSSKEKETAVLQDLIFAIN